MLEKMQITDEISQYTDDETTAVIESDGGESDENDYSQDDDDACGNVCQICGTTISTKWVYSWYEDMVKCYNCIQKFQEQKKFDLSLSKQKMYETMRNSITKKNGNKIKDKKIYEVKRKDSDDFNERDNLMNLNDIDDNIFNEQQKSEIELNLNDENIGDTKETKGKLKKKKNKNYNKKSKNIAKDEQKI